MHAFRRLAVQAHRRWIWQVVLAYLAAAWLLWWLARALDEAIGLPGWMARAVAVAAIVGLPLVLSVALHRSGPASEPTLRSSDLPYDTPPN